MLIRVDGSSTVPLYEQIAAGVRRAITEGAVGRGDRLPAAKELGASLDVNMHTVLKAYGQLRDEGIIEMRRGRGVTVVDQPADHALLAESARKLVADARRAGLTAEEIIRLVDVRDQKRRE